MDNDLDNDLDISWIDEHEKELNIGQLLLKEPVNEIELNFIYINKNGYIEYLKKEKQDLRIDNDNDNDNDNDLVNDVDNDELEKKEKRMISKERVLYLIQKNKWNKMNENGINKKYKLNDLLLFHIDLEPENIQHFSQFDDTFESLDGRKSSSICNDTTSVSSNSNLRLYKENNLKSLPFFGEIVVPDSLFIFHSIHCVYFIFKEVEKEEIKRVLKPILKKHDKTRKIIEGGEVREGQGEVREGRQKPCGNNFTKKVGFSNDITQPDYMNSSLLSGIGDGKTRKNHE